MPGFNGTGPNGQGPMTGRGMGQCRGAYPAGSDNIDNESNGQTNNQPLNPVAGQGFGRQAGIGRGMGRRGGGFGRGFCNGSQKRIRGGR